MPEPADPSRPSVAVMGAGSIGCHLGGRLAAVADVTLIGRPAAMDELGRLGLTLTGGQRPGTHLDPGALRLATTPDAAAGADYVLVTVKSAATASAAADLAPHLAPGAVVVSFQNGLRNADTLAAALPGHTVLGGMVPYNVVRGESGRFHQGTSGTVMLDRHERAGRLMRALELAGVRAQARPDMREVRHAKLLMNLNNAVNALSGLPLREQLAQRDYRMCLSLCQVEALAAFRAEGVRPTRLGLVPPAATPYLLRLPDGLFRRAAAAELRVDAEARSSMWEDLRRGRPTEIDALQGEVVALAAGHGLAAPANERLAALVRRAEAVRSVADPSTSAPLWTGAALLAELRS